MTIEGQVSKILAIVTAQTDAIAALSASVAGITEGDTTALESKIDALTVAVAAVKGDLETDDSTPPVAAA